MARDSERVERLQAGIREAGLDALVCTLPEDVLLLTGYFPVVGTSVAVATRDFEILLLVPEDEQELAEAGADRVVALKTGDLGEVRRHLLESFGLNGKVVACECGESSEPASYVSMHLYGNAIFQALEGTHVRPAGELLARMKAVLTPIEVDRVRRACRIAGIAFEQGAREMVPGLKETEAAANFQTPLTTVGIGFEGVERAGGDVFCMSGLNSAKAWGAYARSRARKIEVTDFALVHCNSHADGYWTDITRTYCMKPGSDRHCRMYEFVFEACRAALERIGPGVRAADVDAAARDVMR
jgi:Xaa-Pro aminopeptidase